jgi:hypothetical protein
MFAWPGNNTLGVWPTPGHPALKGFPHDGHSDWHWHELTADSTAFRFDRLPEGLTPIVQAIPDFHQAKPLLQLFEATVGEGRLLVSGYDLSTDLGKRPVARQLRACLLSYLQSDAFAPTWSLPPEEARELFAGWEKHPRQDEWKIADCDSQETSGEDGRARNAIDGDPGTLWHTEWVSANPQHPHHLTIDLGGAETVTGLRYLPRQDGANGRVARYQVFTSEDGLRWEQAAEGSFENRARPATVRFDAAVRARYVKFVALSEVTGNPWSSAAELSPTFAN